MKVKPEFLKDILITLHFGFNIGFPPYWEPIYFRQQEPNFEPSPIYFREFFKKIPNWFLLPENDHSLVRIGLKKGFCLVLTEQRHSVVDCCEPQQAV